MEHFSWMSLIPWLNQMPDHTATALFVAALLIALALVARRQLAAAPDAVIPDNTLSARNFFEMFVEQFSALAENIIGPGARRFVPLYGTFFLFILFSNLIGLVPGFSPPTSNFNVTLGLGICSFVLFNYFGIEAHGIGGYLKHFLGPVAFVAPLLFVLEVIGVIIRPVTLGLRLAANMTADHLVLGIFTDLTKVVVPVAFYALGAFVCLVQTFVFTLLSLVYVSLAAGGHAEEHGDEAHAGHH
jgi:F-type H+-transporting ATPase subunit a